jgi:hypothetical protein
MKDGKTITLAALSTDKAISTLQAMNICIKKFPFFDKKILFSNYDGSENDIEIKKVNVSSYVDYNKFMVEDLNFLIETDFVLIVQDDGYVINGNLWEDDFLNYDYIGAPWPWHFCCGNGGFSLRSKKFLEVSSTLKYEKEHDEYDCCPEDSFLCLDKYKRNYMVNNGIKFADVQTALKFSFEHPVLFFSNHTIKNSFGFHGKFNLSNV